MRVRMFLGILAAAAGAVLGQEDYSTWAHFKNVTINTSGSGANVAGGVANYPLLVRLTSAQADVFSQAAGNGADIRFTDSAGTTRLRHQRERWDSAGQAAEFWVLVPGVAGDGNTTIRMSWGKGGAADSSRGSQVFSPSNGFVAVWHLNETGLNAGSTIADATGNGHTGTLGIVSGTNVAAPVDTTGAVGVGKKFVGNFGTSAIANGAYFTVDNADSALNLNTNTGPYTLSAWANASVCHTTARMTILSKYNNGDSPANGRAYALQTGNTSGFSGWRLSNDPLAFQGASGTTTEYVAEAACTVNEWTYLAGTYNSNGASPTPDAAGAANARLFKNDTISGLTRTTGTINAVSVGNTATVYIGRLNNADRFLRGGLDEVRVSNVARSADWMKLDYETQKSGATAVSLGPTQSPGAPPSNLSYSQNPAIYVVGAAIVNNTATVIGTVTSYSVSPALPAGLALNASTGVISGTPTTAAALANYTVTATNAAGSTTATLTLTVNPAPTLPSITSNPQSVTVTAGGSARFGVTATGTAPLTYKWVKNNTDTVGGIDSLTLNNIPASDNGATFKCVVRNASGQAISASATLTVLSPPAISQQPSDQNAVVGGTVKFGITAAGTPPLTYRWVKNNTDTVAGAQGDTLTLPNVQFSDSGTYKCVVRNASGTAVSNSARLMVQPVGIADAGWGAGSPAVRISGSSVTISLPEGAREVSVWSVRGGEAWSRSVTSGTRSLIWDKRDARGKPVPAGLYFFRIRMAGEVKTMKATLLP